jgi:hypothetical protein
VTFALFVTLVAAVVYLLPVPAKPAELARIAYFVGLLWLLYHLAAHGLALR